MTPGNIMFAICIVAFAVGTVGFVKDIKVKRRQRRREKYYAAMRQADADNK